MLKTEKLIKVVAVPFKDVALTHVVVYKIEYEIDEKKKLAKEPYRLQLNEPELIQSYCVHILKYNSTFIDLEVTQTHNFTEILLTDPEQVEFDLRSVEKKVTLTLE